VRADTIGRISIGGVLAASTIRATLSIGNVSAGAIQVSQVFAGVRADVTGLPSAATGFAETRATIASVTVRGRSSGTFSDSQIATWDLGAVSLARIRPDNRGAPFGVAAHRVRVLRASTAGRPETFRDLTAPAGPISLGGDAIARLV